MVIKLVMFTYHFDIFGLNNIVPNDVVLST